MYPSSARPPSQPATRSARGNEENNIGAGAPRQPFRACTRANRTARGAERRRGRRRVGERGSAVRRGERERRNQKPNGSAATDDDLASGVDAERDAAARAVRRRAVRRVLDRGVAAAGDRRHGLPVPHRAAARPVTHAVFKCLSGGMSLQRGVGGVGHISACRGGRHDMR